MEIGYSSHNTISTSSFVIDNDIDIALSHLPYSLSLWRVAERSELMANLSGKLSVFWSAKFLSEVNYPRFLAQ